MPGYGKMPQQVTLPWHSDMQLASKLVLSAAALLLLTLAYRFYRSRSLAGGRSPPAEVGEERESASRHGDGDGDGEVALRRRRGLGEEVRRAGGHGEASEEQGSGCVTACGDRRLLREEEEMEEEGEEMVRDLGLWDGRAGMAGRESGLRSEQGSNLGREMGSELGNQLGREMGSELGSQTGKDLEYGLGNELGSKPGTELASKREHKLGREVGSKLGSQMGREKGSELGSQLGREMGSELGSQIGKDLEYGRGSELGSKVGSELASKRGHKVGREMGSKLGSQVGREMGSELGSHPGMDLEYGLESELGSKSGSEEESKLRSKQGSKPGRELASKRGHKLGSELESKVASKPGKKSGSKLAIELGSKEGSDVGRELGSKLGSGLGSELGKEPGINLKSYLRSELGSEPGSRLGKESGRKLGSELASKPGSDLGNEPGSKVGSQPGREPSSHDSRGTAKSPSISRQEASLSPSSKPPPATADAQMGGDGHTQSMEQDVAIRGMSQEAEGCRELIQTLSITSGLGLTMTASNAGSDTSYSFSSVAKIQVEENYITERKAKAGAGQTVPGLRGKVYDYYVQSISQSVVKKRSCLYTPPGTSQRRSLELFNEELRSRSASQESGPAPATQESDPAPTTQESGPAPAPQESGPAPATQESDPAPATQESDPAPTTQESDPAPAAQESDPAPTTQESDPAPAAQESDPAPATQESDPAPTTQESDPAPATKESDPTPSLEDFTISSIAPPPTGSLDIPSEPPSPGHKVSILQIADSPHLQLPMEGFGVTAEATTPPASPQAGLGHDADFFQTWPATRLDLGNCYEVLCAAKARKLGELQEAAYQVMSDNYLQVLRTPAIYGRLNAAERELILRRRMKGKRCVAVADVSPQEPGGPRAGRLCYYDEAGDSWHHLCHLPPEAASRGCAVCSMFNYLFVAAGCEGAGRARRPSNRVFCYDPLANLWREICPLNQARPRCKLVALDGHLYAIGGECLCTVERYDPRRDRWSFAAPLPRDTFAVAHAAAACQGEIYVTGGTLRSLLLRYAARTDSWSLGLAGGGKERTVEMVSTDGFLYRFDLHPSAGIGVYRCGAKAKLWYQCAAYPLPDLPGFQCAVLGSLVHCVGRHFHLRFLADHVSPRFGAKELQPFPEPCGSLFPAVLVLPEGGRAQRDV